MKYLSSILFFTLQACGDSSFDEDDEDGLQGGNTYTSYFQYNVVAGQTYLIGVDSWTYDQADTFILDLDIEVGVSCAP